LHGRQSRGHDLLSTDDKRAQTAGGIVSSVELVGNNQARSSYSGVALRDFGELFWGASAFVFALVILRPATFWRPQSAA
jgi:hypothetical protein